MTENETVSGASDKKADSAVPSGLTSVMESLAPPVADRFGSGNFGLVAGGVSLFRAIRSYRKGDRKRALLRGVVGLFWVGIVLARRRGRSDGSGLTASEVADTSPNIEGAVEPGRRDTDHATGENVVNTTDADIEESDTVPELDGDPTEGDVDQRDVTGTNAVETAAESDDSEESETGEDAEGESAE
jgi:hypothetical protein